MPAIKFSNFEVDLEFRELRCEGVRVPLQHKPFRILELLLRHPGFLVTRRELAQELWAGLHVNFEHSLNSAMNSLRLALGDSQRTSRFIETRPGLGYRFIAPIEASSVVEDYLKGRFFLNKMTDSGVQRAIGYFQSALKESPNHALSLSGLADAYSQLALSGTTIAASARESVSAALRAKADLAETHVSLGRLLMIFDWDCDAAAQAFQRALELNPNLPDAYRARALLNSALKRPAEALADLRRARTIEPLSLPIGYELAWALYLAGRFEEAIVECWNVLALEPGFFPAQQILGLAHAQLEAHDEAITECENACTCSERHPCALASLGYAYAKANALKQAEQILDELLALGKRQHVSPYFIAIVQLGIEKQCDARASIEAAYAERDPLLLWLNSDPRLQLVAGMPFRFQSPSNALFHQPVGVRLGVALGAVADGRVE